MTADRAPSSASSSPLAADASPWMKDYFSMAADRPGVVLAYQMGDFLEVFGPMAARVAAACDLPLRTQDGVHMIFFPFGRWSTPRYLEAIVRAGLSVAVALQVESGEEARSDSRPFPRREVTAVFMP